MSFSMKKVLLGLCLIGGVSLNSHAVEVGIGARLGAEMSITNQLAKTNNGTYKMDMGDDYRNVGAAFTMGVFTDIWFFDWMALTPAFNMSLFRNSGIKIDEFDGTFKQSVVNHAFDIELLAKFKIGWWYGAVGPGVTILTKPTTTTKFDGDTVKSTSDAKGHIGFNLVLDTGVYIPLGAGNHNIMVGLRGTIDFMAMAAKKSSKFDEDQFNGNITDIKGYAQGTPFALGLTVGYVYKF